MANLCFNYCEITHKVETKVDLLELYFYIGYFFPKNALPPSDLLKKEIKNPTIIPDYDCSTLSEFCFGLDNESFPFPDDETLIKMYGYDNLYDYCKNTYDINEQFDGWEISLSRKNNVLSASFQTKWGAPDDLFQKLSAHGYKVENYWEVGNDIGYDKYYKNSNKHISYYCEFELKKYENQKLHKDCDKRLLSFFDDYISSVLYAIFLEEYGDIFDYLKLSHDPEDWSDSEEKLLYLFYLQDDPLKAAKSFYDKGFFQNVNEFVIK